MAKKSFVINKISDFDKVAKELEKYEKELHKKLEKFIDYLMDKGIDVAKQNSQVLDDLGNIHGLIMFSKKVDTKNDGCYGLVYAKDISTVTSVWHNSTGLHTAEVSPLLMAEFGSGQFAISRGIDGVGRGTFPGQKHANKAGWYWQEEEGGELHYSKGIQPTMPMYHASQEMRDCISEALKIIS